MFDVPWRIKLHYLFLPVYQIDTTFRWHHYGVLYRVRLVRLIHVFLNMIWSMQHQLVILWMENQKSYELSLDVSSATKNNFNLNDQAQHENA